MWRGHNRESNLGRDSDKIKYLEFLNEDIQKHKEKVGAILNALTLMSTHDHNIYNILEQKGFSNHMRRHHGRYGQYFNKEYSRSGKVAEDRPKTNLIADDEYLIRATMYVHANPVRAGITKNARDYQWSTHNLYAYGKRASWMRCVQLPNWYLRLGRTPELRQRRYRQMFERYMAVDHKKEYGLFLRVLFLGPVEWQEACLEELRDWKEEHLNTG